MARRLSCLVVAGLALLGGLNGGCGGENDPGFVEESEAQLNANSGPGEFAVDFLRAAPYSKLTIEIDVVGDATPSQEAIDTLVASIQMLCNKSAAPTVLFPSSSIPASTEASPEYTLDEISTLELDHRDNYRKDDTAVMYFLFVDGHSNYDDPDLGTQVLGLAYHGSSMVIFMEAVAEGRPIPVATALMKSVMVHEFGHIIGLVDNGTDMVTNHLDPEESHGAHCINTECMMFWLNNSSDILDYVLSGDVADFDDNCLNDIKAAGGKDALGVEQPN